MCDGLAGEIPPHHLRVRQHLREGPVARLLAGHLQVVGFQQELREAVPSQGVRGDAAIDDDFTG